MRPICIIDGCPNIRKPNGKSVLGHQLYYKMCSSHRRNIEKQGITTDTKRLRKLRYRRSKYNGYIKKDTCDMCGFVCKIIGQMDVDHINGDKSNNNYDNLQTLCSNCHRLKSWKNDDYKNTHRNRAS